MLDGVVRRVITSLMQISFCDGGGVWVCIIPNFFYMADKVIKPTTFEYPSATSNVWVTIRAADDVEGKRDYKVLFYKKGEQVARYATSNPVEIAALQSNQYVVEL